MPVRNKQILSGKKHLQPKPRIISTDKIPRNVWHTENSIPHKETGHHKQTPAETASVSSNPKDFRLEFTDTKVKICLICLEVKRRLKKKRVWITVNMIKQIWKKIKDII